MAILYLVLSAGCGGGSDDPGSGAPSINGIPVASAGANQTAAAGRVVSLDGSGSTDPDGDKITYAWTLERAPAGSVAPLTKGDTSTPAIWTDVPGVYRLTLIVNDGRAISRPTAVEINAIEPEIVVGSLEPLSEQVMLSLSLPVNANVTWFVDTIQISDGPLFARWSTRSVPNGPHLLTARINTGVATAYSVQRQVTVQNSPVALTTRSQAVDANYISIEVETYSPFGITQVTASTPGADPVTLTRPNACHSLCSGFAFDFYRLSINATAFTSGFYDVLVTSVDAANNERSVTVKAEIAKPPALNVTAPVDFSSISGVLRLSGTTFSDRNEVVTVVAQIGNVEFLRTTQTSFTAEYQLLQLPGGRYTVRVIATDARGLVARVERSIQVN